MKDRVKQILKDIGYVRLALLAVCGIFLILVSMPGQKEERIKEEEPAVILSASREKNDIYIEKMEQRLEETLGQMKGVGRVTAMITLKESSESVVNKDISYENATETQTGEQEKNDTKAVKQEETVLSEEDGEQKPYVIKEVEPVIEGVIVVMEGGDNSVVVNAVTEAVQALFPVEAHKIKVLKMEDGA